MVSREEAEGAQAFVEQMLSITQRLMLVVEDEVTSAASGVIVSLCDRYYLLSAGHALVRQGRWFVETNVQYWPPKMLVLNVPDPVSFDTPKENFGWAELDITAIEAQFRADRAMGETTLAIPYYRGTLEAAASDALNAFDIAVLLTTRACCQWSRSPRPRSDFTHPGSGI